jgi:hypothetical protein
MAELGDIAIFEANLIIENGDIKIASRTESTLQRVRIGVLHVLGEWFRDPSRGVNWFARGGILTKPFSKVIADRELRRAVQRIPGVLAVESTTITAGTDRTLTVRIRYRDRFTSGPQTIEVTSP